MMALEKNPPRPDATVEAWEARQALLLLGADMDWESALAPVWILSKACALNSWALSAALCAWGALGAWSCAFGLGAIWVRLARPDLAAGERLGLSVAGLLICGAVLAGIFFVAMVASPHAPKRLIRIAAVSIAVLSLGSAGGWQGAMDGARHGPNLALGAVGCVALSLAFWFGGKTLWPAQFAAASSLRALGARWRQAVKDRGGLITFDHPEWSQWMRGTSMNDLGVDFEEDDVEAWTLRESVEAPQPDDCGEHRWLLAVEKAFIKGWVKPPVLGFKRMGAEQALAMARRWAPKAAQALSERRALYSALNDASQTSAPRRASRL
jgi:hypothetical protein